MQYNFKPLDLAIIQDHIDYVGTFNCIAELEKAALKFSTSLHDYLNKGKLRPCELEKVSKAHADLIISLRAFSMYSNDHLLNSDIDKKLKLLFDIYSHPDLVLP